MMLSSEKIIRKIQAISFSLISFSCYIKCMFCYSSHVFSQISFVCESWTTLAAKSLHWKILPSNSTSLHYFWRSCMWKIYAMKCQHWPKPGSLYQTLMSFSSALKKVFNFSRKHNFNPLHHPSLLQVFPLHLFRRLYLDCLLFRRPGFHRTLILSMVLLGFLGLNFNFVFCLSKCYHLLDCHLQCIWLLDLYIADTNSIT